MTPLRHARRLDALPEYLAAQLGPPGRRGARRRRRRDLARRSATPTSTRRSELAEALHGNAAAPTPTATRPTAGLAELREAVARYYATRFGVQLDPEREVVPLLGAKEGLAHLCLAQLDPGDAALVADPGYPVYAGGPTLAGAEPVRPAAAGRARLPAGPRRRSPAAARERANLLLCGYPNNPTGAVAEPTFFERLAAFGREHDVPICHDNAYAEITFDGYVAPSFLAAPGAQGGRDRGAVAVEGAQHAGLARGVRRRQRRAGRER